jgi:AsmA protein
MKIIKWLIWGALALLLVVVAAAAYIIATVDPNDYKPEEVRLVKEKTGRTLTIGGDIELRFYPKIGAAIQDVTLSAPNSDAAFARVSEARVALALLPLLSRQFIVDEITLTGLQADLVKFKDGSTNFDDLLGGKTPEQKADEKTKPAAEPGPAPVFDIGGIALRDARVGWRDETNGKALQASNVNLETGRIASGVPGELKFSARVDGTEPKLALQLDVAAGYRFDLDKQAGQLSNLDIKASGDAADLSALQLHIKGDTAAFDPADERIDLNGIEAMARAGDMLDARFAIPQLLISRARSESKPISGEVKYKTPERSIAAKFALAALSAQGSEIRFAQADVDVDLRQQDLAVAGRIGSPVMLDLDAQRLELAGLIGDLTVSGPKVPNKSAKLHLEGQQGVNWGEQTAHADLRVRLEDGTVHAKADVKGFDEPAIRFAVEADRLDVDRYLPPEDAPSGAGAAPGGGSAPAKTGPAGKQADAPIDLAWLKPLQMQGSVKVGQLVVSRIKAANVRVGVQAAGGRLALEPITAALYQGTLQGDVVVNANDNAYTIKQRLSGVSIGPLLRDAAQKDLLEGRGNVDLNVRTTGTSADALKRALNGTASMALKDGALKGINLAEALRKAKAVLGSQSASEQLAKGGEQTDFSDLTASFRIQNGIAHNEDLSLRSPFLRVAGSGDVNIPAASLDYSVKASLVNTSTGQGGKALSDVGSITVPVQISGPMDGLKYRLDTRALIEGQAKDALKRQLEKRLGGDKDGKTAPEGDKRGGSIGEQLLRGLIKK